MTGRLHITAGSVLGKVFGQLLCAGLLRCAHLGKQIFVKRHGGRAPLFGGFLTRSRQKTAVDFFKLKFILLKNDGSLSPLPSEMLPSARRV